MKTTECERCGKTINRLGNRKYCTKCRIAVDREIRKRYVEKHIVPDELRKNKKKSDRKPN